MSTYRPRPVYPFINVLAILVLVPLCAARDAVARRLKARPR